MRPRFGPRAAPARPQPAGRLTMASTMQRPTASAARRPGIDHAEAIRLAGEEFDRVVQMLRSLGNEDWTRPTACPGWDVRDLASHMLGMAEMVASVPEQVRQMSKVGRRMWAQRKDPGRGPMVDAMTAVQVDDRKQLTPEQIVERFAVVASKAARARGRIPDVIRRRKMPGDQPVGGKPESPTEPWTIGFLTDVVLTRDPWLHRSDIAEAT